MKEKIYGTIDIESLAISLGARTVSAEATVRCWGIHSVEPEILFDQNGTGYPGWDGIEVDKMQVDSWSFYDEDGNETELSADEQETAEKQILLAAEDNEDGIVWCTE